MNRGKKIGQAAALLAAAALAVWAGRDEIAADFTEQEPWHLICAEAVAEGVEVEIAGENLMLHSGVRVMTDSEESSAFCAEKVRDGICDEQEQRWSSANDWENNEHWLEVSFPEEVNIGLVRLFWERTNAQKYTLEYSSDQKNWNTAASFLERPKEGVQDIRLESPVSARYLRLHVTEVAKEEEDLSLYYQNVSILEMEVYEGIESAFLVQAPVIPAGEGRWLEVPKVPEEYSLQFAGADYEMLVETNGEIADTIADTVVELGFSLSRDGVFWELPGMRTELPASCPAENAGEEKAVLPKNFSVMEWRAGEGSYELSESACVLVSEEEADELLAAAELFAEELSEVLGRDVEVFLLEEREKREPEKVACDVWLTLSEKSGQEQNKSLGEEGYELVLDGAAQRCSTVICAGTSRGIRWGCVAFEALLKESEGRLPKGMIRDYPRYSVRGFGIDVGRRPVSLELLYRIVKEMSGQKMNTLLVHLNDNQIIAQSDYDGTGQGARSLYAGFRLESDMKNAKGEGITSSDLFYTKEEFKRFIEDAAVYGVKVVPEIDTPAHSLALTKVFPDLGLSGDPESVDQLDLSNPKAVQLGKDLWSEYLEEKEQKEAVFSACEAVHIGMDEYFGDEKEYISYLAEIAAHVRNLAPDKDIRIWGSLSKIAADHRSVPKDIQMHIWDTDWADPYDMYREGFEIINSLSSSLYIIPGGGYDWLDQDFLEEKWQPNVFETEERTWTLPSYSSRMLGACYMMWNDWSQVNGESISEEDLFARFEKPLAVIAGKLWGLTEG